MSFVPFLVTRRTEGDQVVLCDSVSRQVANWSQGAAEDDITVVAVKVR